MGRLNLRPFGYSHAVATGNFFSGRIEKPGKAAKSAQKVLSKGYSRFPLDADAKEDRQQFGV
jgi:hypothetical protein